MEAIVFFKAFVNAFILVIVAGALIFWIVYILIKIKKETKFWFKYHFWKKKYKEEDVALLINFLDKGLNETDLLKELLMHSKLKKAKIDELIYIYREMQGGSKK